MAKTKNITVSNGADTAVTASIWTEQIAVGEDPSVASWPTTDFLVKKPTSADAPRRNTAGSVYTFFKANRTPYAPGEVAGYIRTVAGTTTFFTDETGY